MESPEEGCTPHLNLYGLQIRSTPTAGRGVFASIPLAAHTLIEISPVLLFGADEYETYGRHTLLDSYTYIWEKRAEGSTMALALGLGSLFNHASRANVTYTLDRAAACIKYKTVRAVGVNEELCISYGAGTMWWEPPARPPTPPTEAGEWALLGGLALGAGSDSSSAPQDDPRYVRAPVDDGVPLWRITASPDPRTMPLETTTAWAMDVPPKVCASVASVLQTLHKSKQLGTEGSRELRHLRTFRKAVDVSPIAEDSVVAKDSSDPSLAVLVARAGSLAKDELIAVLQPALADLASVVLYRVRVPVCAAPSRARLAEWAAVWPCLFLPPGAGLATGQGLPGSDAARATVFVDRRADAAVWTDPQKLAWVRSCFQRCLATAQRAIEAGEVGVGALVTSDDGTLVVDAMDTRASEAHPLRHAIPNAIRAVAAWRTSNSYAADAEAANGQDYLLTHLSLFLTHEPCVYCAMALTHSRVRTVYFLWPSLNAGGFCGAHAGPHEQPACLGGEDGGPYAIHEQSGLNHCYDVWRWVDPSVFAQDMGSVASRCTVDV